MQNRDLLHPISESSVILTYFQTKNTLILEDIIPTFHSVACQQGGPDSIFLQSVLIVRWTKWQVLQSVLIVRWTKWQVLQSVLIVRWTKWQVFSPPNT